MFDHSSITEPVSPYQTIGRSPKSRQSINGYFDNAPEPGPAATPSSARTLKARPSLHGLYKKPSVSEMRSQPVSAAPTPAAAKLKRVSKPPAVKAISAASRAPPPRSPSPKKMSPKKAAPVTSPKKETAMKSSQTLRETIAAAKAAKKAAMAKQAAPGVSQSDITSPVVPNDSFDFGLDDPFNQGGNDPAKGLLRKRIDAARTDGRLNIAAMGFSKIPDEVMNMYNLEAINGEGGSWAESVDLTRFIAADNLFETLSDDVFPDRDREDLANDEDAQGNQFGGLETLDLHGNVLITLPMGLRRLEQLTVLNLSNNKLTDSAFDIISQIPSLRDLKLANNVLTGELSPSILQLTKLESLDLHKNKITSLPAGLSGLTQLRSFNVSENLVSSLPFDSLRGLPLTELLASSNKLSGTLIEAENIRLPNLKTFDVSCNAITLLASGSLVLPSLQILNISANRITALPSVETWESLMTLSAADNSITAIPEGFVTLRSVKIVDVAGNDIRTLDDRIALMESLTTLVISGNPLITKKWAGMNTADLKRALLARLEPAEVKPLSPEPHYASPKKARPESQDFFQHTRNISEASMVTAIQDHASDADTEYLSPSASAPATTPPLPTSPGMEQWRANINTALGCLDRSHTQSTSLNPLIAAQIAAENKIKTLELHHNMFGEIPASIAFFGHTLTSLNLSHNGLTSDTWLKEELELPNLVELNLSSNTFDSLSPILKNLTAPQLARLDVSFNRLTTLPTSPSLHSKFPLLGILLASNNTIRELSPLSIAGCRMVDVTSNEIERLDPRLGLLKELARFECAGNRFRVPNWKVVEKGTGSVLEWCRGRLSVEEIEEWEAREAERMGGGSPRKRGMVEEGEFGGQGWVL